MTNYLDYKNFNIYKYSPMKFKEQANLESKVQGGLVVVYARKSTESDEEQAASICSQLNTVIPSYDLSDKSYGDISVKTEEFAKSFETAEEREKRETDKDIANVKIRNKYKHLCIIREQHSARDPWKRPKRNKLMKRVKKGKIKAIISFKVDRQVRNIAEGGELIHYTDSMGLGLFYNDFNFEPTANGKMLLTLQMAIAANYTDNLSEHVKKGLNHKASFGKSFGVFKYGYKIEKEIGKGKERYNGYHKPDGKNFELMKEAFRLKLYENRSDKYIAKRLNNNGFNKFDRGDRDKKADPNTLWKVRPDPFYCGKHHYYGGNLVDLSENPHFKPLINEQEHQVLYDRYLSKKKHRGRPELKQEQAELHPLEYGILHTEDGAPMTFCLPNPARHRKKLAKLQETKPTATLKDVVKPTQIQFKCTTKSSKQRNETVRYGTLYNGIIKVISSFSLPDNVSKKVIKKLNQNLKDKNSYAKKRIKQLELNRGKIEKELDEAIEISLSRKLDDKEVKIYEKKKLELEQKIASMNVEIADLKKVPGNKKLEAELLIKLIKEVVKNCGNFDYVRLKKTTKIFVSNIVYGTDSTVTYGLHPYFEYLHSLDLSPPRFERRSNP